MSAERRRPADLDVAHHHALLQRCRMRLPVCIPVHAEDVGELVRWAGRMLDVAVVAASHPALPERLSLLRPQKIQWALGAGDVPRADLGVQLGGPDRLVAEQHLDRANVSATLEHMGSERVA